MEMATQMGESVCMLTCACLYVYVHIIVYIHACNCAFVVHTRV